MDFRLTEEQRLFAASVRAFAERHLRAGALARAHDEQYPWDVAQLMAGQGLLGITVPEEAGGLGGSLMDAVVAIQEVARVCPRSADVVQAGNFGALRVLAQHASAEQRERYLKPLLAGTGLIAVAMTEPNAGSAVTELTTSLTPDGDGYRLSGSKIFTTHGLHATVFLAYARFGPGVGGIGWVQEADRRLQRRAPRQQLPGACARPVCVRGGAPARPDAPAVRPSPVGLPGPAMEVRRDEAAARGGAASALPGGQQRRPGAALAGGDGARQARLQPRRLQRRE